MKLFWILILVLLSFCSKARADFYGYNSLTVVPGVITIPANNTTKLTLATVTLASLTATSIGLLSLTIFPQNETSVYEAGFDFKNPSLSGLFIQTGLFYGFNPGSIFRFPKLGETPQSIIPGDLKIWVQAHTNEPSPVAMPFIAVLGY